MAHGALAEFEPEILFEGQYLGGEGLVEGHARVSIIRWWG